MTPDVTVIIPTRDEGLHVERCVASARRIGEIWVVDSGSTDDTVERAEAVGARVVRKAWLGHARQKNWAIDNLPIRTAWVLFLDADEIVPEPLVHEISQVVTDPATVAWYVARRNVFLGRELRHVWWYPDYQLRLFRKGSARYEDREVHEHMVTAGPVGYLREPLIHENLKGVDAFLERHVRYARAEAREIAQGRKEPRGFVDLRTRVGRRRFLKTQIWQRLPFRPAIRFAWLYVARRGFLDGEQGRIYSQLIASYEAMIDAFILDDRMARRAPHLQPKELGVYGVTDLGRLEGDLPDERSP